MAKYEDLIFDLRMHEKRLAFSGLGDSIECKLMKQSADAIEELLQIASHYEEECKGWWLAACEAKERATKLAISCNNSCKWIPVEERLPERDTEVLVYAYNHNIWVWEYHGNAWEAEDGYYHELDVVTHWMPLPEPPKDGES